MRMKEVCDRTGLTDRAVRLYIDSGLIAPERVSSYTGRSAIHFSEGDVAVLEAVATLRRAGFAIGDIKTMMDAPDDIPAVIAAHRAHLAEDIEQKQAVLRTLSGLGDADCHSYADVADIIRNSTSSTTLPKEDLGMSFKEIKRIIRGRIPSLLALVAMVIGLGNLYPLAYNTSFAEPMIKSGGGYELHFSFTAHEGQFVLAAYMPVLLLTAGAVLLVVYLLGGKKRWLIASLCCCAASVLAMLLLPTQVEQRMFIYEFTNYRYSFMHSIFFGTSKAFDRFIQALKYIPHILALILGIIGLWREKELPEA